MKIVPKRRSDFFDDMFDNVFRSPFFSLSDKIVKMQTDIKEKDGNYILDIDLAGFDKKDINITFEDGYMTVQANVDETKEENQGEYIRKERHIDSCSRSYYVGNITEEDIKANYQNGILSITLPKQNEKLESKKYIPID